MPRRAKTPPSLPERVESILDDPRVILFPIKHFSPACAHQVRQLIHDVQPGAVMVEGPADATDLIPFITHTETEPPLSIFSYYTDKRNVFELNGVLSPNRDIPARFRAWWPMTSSSPEYAALCAGCDVGADVSFIDLPLHTLLPFQHVRLHSTEHTPNTTPSHLESTPYLQALCAAQRRPSLAAFWNANMETAAWNLPTRDFRRLVLTFALCARDSLPDDRAKSLHDDGTLVREAHMRYCIDTWIKKNPDKGPVVVVVGAFHAAALPDTKRKKASIRKDKNLETMLTAHSFRALERLSSGSLKPAWNRAVTDAIRRNSTEPYNEAALSLLLEVMRDGRDQNEPLSTADTVGAWTAAQNLARLRRNREVTLEDILDTIEMSYIKGDRRIRAAGVRAATDNVLIGNAVGRVTDEVGQPPLFRDFYTRAKALKVDLSGSFKVVRCDIHKYKAHRDKSAFLHQCDLLQIPLFVDLDNGKRSAHAQRQRSYYKGPDLVTGQDLHLITESWGVEWSAMLDDRLVELSDRGASIQHAAESLLHEQLLGALGNAADTTRILLRAAQMTLLDLFSEILDAVEDAVASDTLFENLTTALHNFTILHTYRDALATHGHQRLLSTILNLYNRAALALPSIAHTPPEATRRTVDLLQTLTRITVSFDAAPLDRTLLTEQLRIAVQDQDANPALRGAGFGVLYSLGATREKIIAKELRGYLTGSPDRVLQAGAFLEGLFISSKHILMMSPRLLRVINDILSQLDWETFKTILPDLRRAFTQFIPSEIDELAGRVHTEIGLHRSSNPQPSHDTGPPPAGLAVLGATSDHRVHTLLQGWW